MRLSVLSLAKRQHQPLAHQQFLRVAPTWDFVGSAKKQTLNSFEAIRQAFLGNPDYSLRTNNTPLIVETRLTSCSWEN